MSCKARLFVVAALAACADNAEVVEVPARARFEVELAPERTEPIADEQRSYRWELVDAPQDSTAVSPDGDAAARFLPDMRGAYVVERWIVYGLTDRLTHRFVVLADGLPPVAVARASGASTVGSTITLDGSTSRSDEGRDLRYRWRLTERPFESAATLVSADTATSSLTLDRTGEYAFELTVFDGELWSTPPSLLRIAAQ